MNGPRLGAGSTLLILIFSVLCLTVSALAYLSTANGERALAEKVAANVQAYYSADCRAVETITVLWDAVQNGDVPKDIDGVAVTAEENGEFSFSVPVDDERVLTVRLAKRDSQLVIVAWQETYVGDWTPDEALTVWTGQELP